jgi:hypothetical protein
MTPALIEALLVNVGFTKSDKKIELDIDLKERSLKKSKILLERKKKREEKSKSCLFNLCRRGCWRQDLRSNMRQHKYLIILNRERTCL